MIARIGTLAVGTRFDTLLTGRQGHVLDRVLYHLAPQEPPCTLVVFGANETKWLHPDVRVRVVHEDFVR